MKNWKTNLAALFTALVGVATAMGYISQEVAGAILTIGVTFGFAVAKDSNKFIGGSNPPPSKDEK